MAWKPECVLSFNMGWLGIKYFHDLFRFWYV